jgi:HEAT repeat protein
VQNHNDRVMEEAMVALHRAVAISQFYPGTHRLLRQSLEDGYEAFLRAAGDERLAQAGIHVSGASLTLGQNEVGAGSPAIGYMANLFTAHRISHIRLTSLFSLEGFEFFVSLLASAPDLLIRKGGFARLWNVSPYIHSLDISYVTGADAGEGRRRGEEGWSGDWSATLPPAHEAETLSNPRLLVRLKAFQQKGPVERELLDLLFNIGQPQDEKALAVSLDRIAVIVDAYVVHQQYRPAFQALTFLYREAQNHAALGRTGSAEQLWATIRTLLQGPFLHWLTLEVASTADAEDAEIGGYLLRLLGETAIVYLINTLAAERNRIGRRRLVGVLVSIGAPAIPYAQRMLDDQRWYVVRNMISVLGGIGDVRALESLDRFQDDADPRIQKEVVRSLGKVKRRESETMLLSYVRRSDVSVCRMAVAVLAGQGTQRAMTSLLEEFENIQLGADNWEIKVAIIEAVGRMPFPEVLPFLQGVVSKKVWLRRARWERIQVAAVLALGEAGGSEAVKILEPLKSHPSEAFRRAAERSLAVAVGGNQ